MRLEKFEEAKKDLLTLIENFPEKTELYDLLHSCYTQLKDIQEAKKYEAIAKKIAAVSEKMLPLSEKIRAFSSDAAVYKGRGLLLEQAGFDELAIKDLQLAIEKDFYKEDPALPELCQKIATSCEKIGDKKNAQKYQDLAADYQNKFKNMADLSAHIEKNQNDVQAYFDRGKCNLSLGRFYPAVEDFDQYLAKKTDDYLAFFHRGQALKGNMSYDKAVASFDQAIALKKDDAQCFYQRALTYVKLKDYDKALADLNQAVDLGMKSAEIFNQRAEVNEQLGKHEAAAADKKKSILN